MDTIEGIRTIIDAPKTKKAAVRAAPSYALPRFPRLGFATREEAEEAGVEQGIVEAFVKSSSEGMKDAMHADRMRVYRSFEALHPGRRPDPSLPGGTFSVFWREWTEPCTAWRADLVASGGRCGGTAVLIEQGSGKAFCPLCGFRGTLPKR